MHPRPGFMALVTWVRFLWENFKGTIPLRRLPMSPHLWPGTESRNQLQYALLLHELYEPRHWACSFEALPSVLFVASNSCLGVGMCIHVCQYTHTPNMYNNLASIYTCISIRTYTHTHTYAHTRTRTYTRSHTLSHTENPTLAHYFKYLCFNWCGSTLIINGLVCLQKGLSLILINPILLNLMLLSLILLYLMLLYLILMLVGIRPYETTKANNFKLTFHPYRTFLHVFGRPKYPLLLESLNDLGHKALESALSLWSNNGLEARRLVLYSLRSSAYNTTEAYAYEMMNVRARETKREFRQL